MKRKTIRTINCRCELGDYGYYYIYFDEECTCDENGADCSRTNNYIGHIYTDIATCEADIPSVNSNMCDGHTTGALAVTCP